MSETLFILVIALLCAGCTQIGTKRNKDFDAHHKVNVTSHDILKKKKFMVCMFGRWDHRGGEQWIGPANVLLEG